MKAVKFRTVPSVFGPHERLKICGSQATTGGASPPETRKLIICPNYITFT